MLEACSRLAGSFRDLPTYVVGSAGFALGINVSQLIADQAERVFLRHLANVRVFRLYADAVCSLTAVRSRRSNFCVGRE